MNQRLQEVSQRIADMINEQRLKNEIRELKEQLFFKELGTALRAQKRKADPPTNPADKEGSAPL